ncbi:ABC transporter substrate-binding protein [Maridesulfovibrio zosterae]|uniref:ABC transporter substrate-binding protein n=1 Tax=Maridesulfovibrio zosterae TaxID=82171 RepID=UPI00040A6CFC|nr:ABC transporter substrate-binding protein [Maridesulfovibrio zosterae]
MCLKSFFLLATISFVAPTLGAYADFSIVDDFGHNVVLSAPAKRIVALYGSFNEVLYSMNSGELLVGRTAADHYPEQIAVLPSIGTHMRPNPELIVALKPDLVLQMAGRSQAATVLDPLRVKGISCAMFKVSSFEELFSMIERIGILIDRKDRSSLLIDSMRKRLDVVHEMSADLKNRPSVFFEVRYPNLLAAGQGSIVSDIISKAGARNCVRNFKKIVRMGEEELFRLDPENYVYQVGRMNPSPVKLQQRNHFKMLKSVSSNRTLKVDESVFSRPGPRNVDAVEILAKFLFDKREINE